MAHVSADLPNPREQLPRLQRIQISHRQQPMLSAELLRELGVLHTRLGREFIHQVQQLGGGRRPWDALPFAASPAKPAMSRHAT